MMTLTYDLYIMLAVSCSTALRLAIPGFKSYTLETLSHSGFALSPCAAQSLDGLSVDCVRRIADNRPDRVQWWVHAALSKWRQFWVGELCLLFCVVDTKSIKHCGLRKYAPDNAVGAPVQ